MHRPNYQYRGSVKLTEAELRDMKERGMTDAEIAAVAVVTKGALRGRLEEYGIGSPAWAKQKIAKKAASMRGDHRKMRLTKAELEDLHINQKLSTADIAKRTGFAQMTIHYALVRNGIKISNKERYARSGRSLKKYFDATFAGNIKNREGYRAIKTSKPGADRRGYSLEHRLVMEAAVGRQLDSEHEEVHHLNFNKSDNRLENLILFYDSDHRRFHSYMERFGAYAAGFMEAPPPPVKFQKPAFFRGQWINEFYMEKMLGFHASIGG